VNETRLLTDSRDPAVDHAVALLEGWQVLRVPDTELATSLGSVPGVRAALIQTNEPSILRSVVERSHGVGVPVIIACADDVGRRRAIELHAEEWYRCPADPEEISARIRSAVRRGVPVVADLADRV